MHISQDKIIVEELSQIELQFRYAKSMSLLSPIMYTQRENCLGKVKAINFSHDSLTVVLNVNCPQKKSFKGVNGQHLSILPIHLVKAKLTALFSKVCFRENNSYGYQTLFFSVLYFGLPQVNFFKNRPFPQ